MTKEKMMSIRGKLLICGAALVALASPITAQVSPAAKVTTAESVQTSSGVSIAVDPTLSDGRLVVKLAVQNRGTAAAAFGPGSVSIAKAAGEPIALVPLRSLIDDVKVAAGEPATVGVGSHATQSAYAAPTMPVDSQGKVDVSGYTGGMAVAPDETLRRTRQGKSRTKPTITPQEADRQIQALRAAVLQDQSIQPRQIVAGQIVSVPLKFKKDEDRTLHLRVRVAGDEHSFTVMAPTK